MAVFTPDKTVNQSLLSWTTVTNTNANVGTPVTVTSKIAAQFFLQIGRASGSAFTAGWPNIRFEASSKSSGDGIDAWSTIFPYQPAVGASIANTTLNGAISAGASSCVVTAATNIAVGDILFLGHTTLSTNYELVRVRAVSGTTITFEENCIYAHDNGAQVTDQAETITFASDLTRFTRIRLVVDNANSGQSVYVKCDYNLNDSWTSV